MFKKLVILLALCSVSMAGYSRDAVKVWENPEQDAVKLWEWLAEHDFLTDQGEAIPGILGTIAHAKAAEGGYLGWAPMTNWCSSKQIELRQGMCAGVKPGSSYEAMWYRDNGHDITKPISQAEFIRYGKSKGWTFSDHPSTTAEKLKEMAALLERLQKQAAVNNTTLNGLVTGEFPEQMKEEIRALAREALQPTIHEVDRMVAGVLPEKMAAAVRATAEDVVKSYDYEGRFELVEEKASNTRKAMYWIAGALGFFLVVLVWKKRFTNVEGKLSTGDTELGLAPAASETKQGSSGGSPTAPIKSVS